MMTSANNKKIDKSKFEFVERTEVYLEDYSLSEPIGYYKDAWLRFKKNRMALVATVIIGIMLIFTLIGPHLKKYDLPKESAKFTNYFREMPPRIPGLEKIGIFTGHKTIRGRSEAFINSLSDYDESIVIKIVKKETTGDAVLVDAVVDYYKYHHYIQMYSNKLTPEGERGVQTRNLDKAEYQRALDRNAVLQLYSIENGVYRTQIDLYKYALNSTPEDTYFWFGTNKSGEDIFTNLWRASRVSLLLAVVIVVINMIIGTTLGSITGYFGGTLDIIFERFVDILVNLPFMVILTLLVLRFGSGFGIIIFAFVFNGWIRFYGTTRMQFYRFKNREYVLAARSCGAGDARIIRKHIFPNAIGTLITSFSLAIPSFIFTESVYSFLGIINYTSSTSIGRMLSEGQENMQQHFHMILFPAIYISLLMLSFNLISNGLRDAFNPSLRGSE